MGGGWKNKEAGNQGQTEKDLEFHVKESELDSVKNEKSQKKGAWVAVGRRTMGIWMNASRVWLNKMYLIPLRNVFIIMKPFSIIAGSSKKLRFNYLLFSMAYSKSQSTYTFLNTLLKVYSITLKVTAMSTSLPTVSFSILFTYTIHRFRSALLNICHLISCLTHAECNKCEPMWL